MSDFFDLSFTAAQNPTRERVEGMLFINESGKSYRAISGSKSLLPLPNGGYAVTNLRFRDKVSMARLVLPEENQGGGISFPAWSTNVDPMFSSRRTLLRIHPDGNLPGTRGCIGILESVNQCYEDIKRTLEKKSSLILLVNHNNSNPNLNG